MTGPEHVQPSSEPDAAVATGSGGRDDAGEQVPPVPPSESASTSGLGSQADQQAAGGPPPGDAPYDLAPEQPDPQDTEPRSPSGT